MNEKWNITCSKEDDELLFTLRWSPWGSMDKWVINRIVPSESGIFQLWVKEGWGIVLLRTEIAFYGGLRSILRETIDDMAPAGRRMRNLIAGKEAWFRFSLSSSREHLDMLKQHFANSADTLEVTESAILVNERETMSRFPLPPPDLQSIEKKRMRDSQFGSRLQKVPHNG